MEAKRMSKRDIITIEDLSNEEIEQIFQLADSYLTEMGERFSEQSPRRVRGRKGLAEGLVLASLFYEPSTRTRFSFESAMIRLGGDILSTADPATTSVTKGETLADTVRVFENYADIIVLRHPLEGAARVASEFTNVPVINAGDGSHEHPTQTLCDLYTLREQKGDLTGTNVLLYGDLKNGRTVHSLIYALARFGANIIPLPGADGLELPDHVLRRLKQEYGCNFQVIKESKDKSDLPVFRVDVLYITPKESHKQTLFDLEKMVLDFRGRVVMENLLNAKLPPKIQVWYVTRAQKERDTNGEVRDYPVVDRKFLSKRRFKETRVLHPLPRVSELSYEIDRDPRGAYFQQAAYGVPVRMALLTSLLKLKGHELRGQGSKSHDRVLYCVGNIPCPNSRCITNHRPDNQYLKPTFTYLLRSPLYLRCVYCEHETQPKCVGNRVSRKYSRKLENLEAIKSHASIVFFADDQQAHRERFERYKGEVKDSNDVEMEEVI